ncbi:MAG: tRNA uridine-5-carboxymethylaminomethyl(34) synthesis GTPase MnmE [Microscillaceae bacterium]|jgi:tRNA modification GTPase|nr:tRNA uridine-5-carboxymethylaminomethyl(34) synthesis GTPase MnmE [Microscillaceae bacterium]
MNLNTQSLLRKEDTIVALSTPPGVGAIAVIRVSGKNTLSIVNQVFRGKDLSQQAGHTLHFGTIRDAQNKVIDEVVLGLFRAPHSFTKEDVVEISCHGSGYIIQKIIELLLAQGARLALAGEFTQRAYLNGQMDLAQAEAIADLIASDSQAAHQLAMQQMRGGFSLKIKDLREKFIRLAALLELELDFAEEDVEFADRTELKKQVSDLKRALIEMADSFSLGNVIKNGVPVVIVGKPNAGKSTLLNALLEEEKAIVSNIPGTTRDAIEDEKIIQGIRFRFVDTAGLRETEDVIEKIGVERTRAKMQIARILIYLFDALTETDYIAQAQALNNEFPDAKLLLVANKVDELSSFDLSLTPDLQGISISAKERIGLENLNQTLYQLVAQDQVSDTIVSNIRHYESLQKARQALEQVEQSMALNLGTELIASDIREAIYHLGAITGEVTNNDLLEFIFSKFCIGK